MPESNQLSARIPARSRRQAMDWSLALLSQGIEATIDCDQENGWGLYLPNADRDRAIAVIDQYLAENRGWPWRHSLPRPHLLFDWSSLAWVIVLGFFFWLQQQRSGFSDAGLMDAAAVSRGEWWRLFTAIFLHADFAHFAGNAGIGLLLLGLTMGCYGSGVGLLAAFLSGVGGNLATWLVRAEIQRSLGASGMVMGCVGLLAAQSLVISRKNPQALKYAVSGLLGGVMLFVLLGLSPTSNVAAHAGGFATGVVLGAGLTRAKRVTRNAAANIFSGAIFCLLVIVPWWRALSGGR